MTGHLVHVGFPKTGSKLLQRWFEEHPQLAFRQWGIAGFGSVLDMVDAANEPAGRYLYRVTSAEGLSAPPPASGSAMIDYDQRTATHRHLQAAACALVTAIAPQARILIVTRGFRAMILSSYSQYLRSGGSEDFEALLARPAGDNPWNYDHVVGLYEAAFGRDNVLTLPYELLRDDREQFAGALVDWLGLRPHPLPAARVNTSLSATELRWYPRLARALARLPIGGGLRGRLLRRYVDGAMANRWRPLTGLLQRLRPASPVTAELVPETLLERFRGQAKSLRGRPFYQRYACDYFLDA